MSPRTSSRREVLRRAGSAVLAAGALPALLAACDNGDSSTSGTAEPSSEPAASADDALVERALRDAAALAATYDATLRRHDGLQSLLARPRDEIREHIDVLSGAAGDSTASGQPPRATPASRRKARRELAAAERTAIRRRRRDAGAAGSGELARFLASIAACHAQHLRLLAPGSSEPVGSTDEPEVSAADGEPVVDALNETLAGEHAALYAYGVIGGRLDYDSRPVRDSTEAWTAHQHRRSALTQLVEAADGSPVGAEPGYELPNDVRTVADARAVAQLVEDRCAVLYATLAATATGAVRTLAVDALIDAATRAVHWGAPTSPLPGFTSVPGRL